MMTLSDGVDAYRRYAAAKGHPAALAMAGDWAIGT